MEIDYRMKSDRSCMNDESCTKRRKKGHFMSLVGGPGERYFSHRSSLYTKLRFSLTFAPSVVDRSFAVRPMRLFVGGHLSPVRGRGEGGGEAGAAMATDDLRRRGRAFRGEEEGRKEEEEEAVEAGRSGEREDGAER